MRHGILAGCMAIIAANNAVGSGYVGIDGGVAREKNTTFILPTAANPNHPTEFKNGQVFALRAGWRFAQYGPGTPRIELEAAWRENSVGQFGGQGSVGPGVGKLRSNAYMLNALYDFRSDSPLIPYFGLGVGWLRTEAKDIRRNIFLPDCCTGIIDGKDSGAAWQGILGVAYEATSAISLTLDYRYLAGMGNMTYGYRAGCFPDGSLCLAQPGNTESKYRNQSISAGLRFSF